MTLQAAKKEEPYLIDFYHAKAFTYKNARYSAKGGEGSNVQSKSETAEHELAFCLTCKGLRPMKRVTSVFKTGFRRDGKKDYPLAICSHEFCRYLVYETNCYQRLDVSDMEISVASE